MRIMATMPTCFIEAEYRAIADLVTGGELFPGWTITRINVPREYRGKGVGTKLLNQIIAAADEAGNDLWLEIVPSGGLDFDELREWYARHGFRKSKEFGGSVMVRRAQP